MPVDAVSLTRVDFLRKDTVACTALVVYEYFLQFGNEVEFFWVRHNSNAGMVFKL
ncbi:hypothetical protein L208DRAFT_1407914 [Tricholoma matsutake]|nr:hypothetical protein L208DRAFT_1407914 [Tricholoma matsutake 945]